MSVPKLLFKDIQLWKMLLLLLGPVSSLWWEKLREREQFAGKGIRACRDALQIITLFPLLRSRFKVSDQKKVDCSHNYSEGRRMAASPWTVQTNSTGPLAPPRARTQTSDVCLIFGAICGVTKWRTQRKSAQLRLCEVVFSLCRSVSHTSGATLRVLPPAFAWNGVPVCQCAAEVLGSYALLHPAWLEGHSFVPATQKLRVSKILVMKISNMPSFLLH